MAAEGSIVISLVTGRSSQRSWTFTAGEPVDVRLGADASCDWQMEGEGVAALHAWLRWDGARLSIAEQPGTAATVDGAAVRGWTAIGDGARVRLGALELFAQSIESDALMRSTRRVTGNDEERLRETARVLPEDDVFARETARVVPEAVEDLAATLIESARVTAAVTAPEPSGSMSETILEQVELEADETWAWRGGTEPETSDPRPAADVLSVAETVTGANVVPLSEAETFPPVLAKAPPGATVTARPASRPLVDEAARTTPRHSADEAARTTPRASAPARSTPGASTIGRAATLAAPGAADADPLEAETIIRVDGDDVEPFVETLIHPGALREPSRPGQAKIVTPPPVMVNQVTQDLPEDAREAATRTVIAPVERRGPVPTSEREVTPTPVVAVATPDPRRARRARGELTPTHHDGRVIRKSSPAVGKGRAFLLGGAVAIASFVIAASVVVVLRNRARPPAPPLPAADPPVAPAVPPSPGPAAAPPDAAPATPPTPPGITPSTTVQHPSFVPSSAPPSLAPPPAPFPPSTSPATPPPSTAPPPPPAAQPSAPVTPSTSPSGARAPARGDVDDTDIDLAADVRVAAGHVIAGRHTEALAAYEELARLDPDDPVYPEAVHILRRKIEARSMARAAGGQP